MSRYVLSMIKLVEHPQFGTVYKHRLQEIVGADGSGLPYLGGEIRTDPNTGVPTEKALLCLVSSKHQGALRDDPEMLLLPQVSHDMKVSSIHTMSKLRCKAAIVAMGHDVLATEAVWDNADGFRDVVEFYGTRNNPDFKADDFNLND